MTYDDDHQEHWVDLESDAIPDQERGQLGILAGIDSAQLPIPEYPHAPKAEVHRDAQRLAPVVEFVVLAVIQLRNRPHHPIRDVHPSPSSD
jgi:hypothetical protein